MRLVLSERGKCAGCCSDAISTRDAPLPVVDALGKGPLEGREGHRLGHHDVVVEELHHDVEALEHVCAHLAVPARVCVQACMHGGGDHKPTRKACMREIEKACIMREISASC